MNTRSLVDYVKRVAPSWSRLDILNFINDAQSIVFSVPVESMKYTDTTSGGDKQLSTVDGTLTYELSASTFGADIQFIKNVYPVNYNENYYGYSGTTNDIYISTHDGIQGTNAIIEFAENPGNAEYYVECYKYPTPVDSESTILSIPEGLILTKFYSGVVGIVETVDHGQSNAMDKFEQMTSVEIRNILNTTGHTNVYLPEGQGY